MTYKRVSSRHVRTAVSDARSPRRSLILLKLQTDSRGRVIATGIRYSPTAVCDCKRDSAFVCTRTFRRSPARNSLRSAYCVIRNVRLRIAALICMYMHAEFNEFQQLPAKI